MAWRLPDDTQVGPDLCSTLAEYRQAYLTFFLDYFEKGRRPRYRGGYFNINSITGRPFEHRCCYSWTDGRSLAELSICYLLELGPRQRLKPYMDHLCACLTERYRLNGYLPHAVVEHSNLAADDSLNVPIGQGQSSYSHVLVMNGLLQYALIAQSNEARALANELMDDLKQALADDGFLEGAQPRPQGQRAQGPFMITLGVCADVLETLEALHGASSAQFEQHAETFVALGRECVAYILQNHYRAPDNAFWEVSSGGDAVRAQEGVVITDPGHTIEFCGFAARLARYLPEDERARLEGTCGGIFLWAASAGFHETEHLICKNVDRDTRRHIADATVEDISQVVQEEVLRDHFGGQGGRASFSTFPWWAVMEALATGAVLRRSQDAPQVDEYILRAVRGIFCHFVNERIGGLCYQTIGGGFFAPVDLPPATPTLDLMHSHRSLRIALRELPQQG